MLKIWPITYSSPNCAWSEGESAEVKQILHVLNQNVVGGKI